MANLNFKIPEQQARSKDSRDLRPKAIEHWLDGLPRANIGVMAKQIYSLLTGSNALILPPADRLSLLQQLYDPIDYILEALEKHYIGFSLPLPTKNQRIVLLVQSLLHEIVIAHKSLILDSVNDKKMSKNRLQLATTMQNHMAFNNRLLLCLNLTYSAVPKSFWREQCLILRYAERLSIADVAVFGSDSPWSVINRFKQAVLLTIAAPYSLGQQEILHLNRHLVEWMSNCHLLSMEKHTPGIHSIFIDLHGSSGPRHIKNPKNHSDSWRIVDTSAINAVLENEIKKNGSNPPPSHLSRETLRRVQKQFKDGQKRQFSRMEKADTFTLAIGVSAIHWMLSHHIGHGGHDVERPASYTSTLVTNVGQTDAPDVWNVYRSAEATTSLAENTSVKPVKYKTYDFSVVDESANGFKLKLKDGDTTAAGLKVGELASLHKGFNGTGKQFGLALVRWIHQATHDELTIGIELIAPNAKPVEVGLYTEEEPSDLQHKMRALLLPSLPAIRQPATLVIPNTFKEGQKILLHNKNKDEIVTLKRQKNRGGSHAQYQYEQVKESPAPLSKRLHDTNQRDNDNLDNVWELL